MFLEYMSYWISLFVHINCIPICDVITLLNLNCYIFFKNGKSSKLPVFIFETYIVVTTRIIKKVHVDKNYFLLMQETIFVFQSRG